MNQHYKKPYITGPCVNSEELKKKTLKKWLDPGVEPLALDCKVQHAVQPATNTCHTSSQTGKVVNQ